MQIANSFCQYFTNIINEMKKNAFKVRDSVLTSKENVPQVGSCFKFRNVTVMETESELRKLKRKKATGLDKYHHLS